MKKFIYFFLILFVAGSFSVAGVSAKTTTKVVAKKVPIKTQVVKKKVTTKKSKVVTKKVATKKGVVAKKSSDYVPPSRFLADEATQKPAYAGAKQPPAGYMAALNVALNEYLNAKKAAHGDKTKLKEAEDTYNAAMVDASAMLQ